MTLTHEVVTKSPPKMKKGPLINTFFLAILFVIFLWQTIAATLKYFEIIFTELISIFNLCFEVHPNLL